MFLLLAVLIAWPSLSAPARERTDASLSLIEVTSGEIEGNLSIFQQARDLDYVKIAGRAEGLVFAYAGPAGIRLLRDHGVEVEVLVEAVSDTEIYIATKTDGLDDALTESGAWLIREGSGFCLVGVHPGRAFGIHMLPFKKRLIPTTGSGLPLVLPERLPDRLRAAPLTYNPTIQSIVDSVSDSWLYDRLSDLSGENDVTIGGEVYNIFTRYSPNAMCRRAGYWLREQFEALGLQTELDYFNFRTVMKSIDFPVDQFEGWAVGKRMTIIHTADGGEVWDELHWGTDGSFNDIDMWDNSNGCVAGNGGLIFLTADGIDWQQVTSPTSEDLNSVAYADAQNLYACGNNGVIITSADGGSSWSTVSSPTSRDLKAMGFASVDIGWAVGESGRIIKTENGGGSWSIASSPVGENLTEISIFSETRAWVSGLNGTVLRTDDGDTWQELVTPVSGSLGSVFFINETVGWACGGDGILIKTIDGGDSWGEISDGILWDYRAVYFISHSLGWIIGGGPFHRSENGGFDWDYLGNNVESGDVNVVATKLGTVTPDEIYIICGHYDCTSQMPQTYAPGADDNGTGTIATLEAARVLKDYDFEATLRFVCFSREEQGLIGSNAYCAEAYERGDNIIAALNFDMIGYEDVNPEDVDIICNTPSQWLGDEYQDAVALYVPGLAIDRGTATYVGSDNSSFWDWGYSAFLGIEDYGLNNPYYHRTTDRISTIDFDFYTDVVRGAVATLAQMAVLDTVSASVAGVFEASGLKVGPNPGRGRVKIEMAIAGERPTAFEIYDIAGRLVTRIEPEIASGVASAAWRGTDASGLPVGPGIYFLKVGERSPATKLVLLK
jgi:photosystem II stability/assembly factor-like uncharacterized protein